MRFWTLLLAAWLSGCAAWYKPVVTTITVPTPVGTATKVPAPVQITTFEQWTSAWSAVCGALVTYQNGQPAQMIPGTCGTPLTMLMGSSLNVGLATAALPFVLK